MKLTTTIQFRLEHEGYEIIAELPMSVLKRAEDPQGLMDAVVAEAKEALMKKIKSQE